MEGDHAHASSLYEECLAIFQDWGIAQGGVVVELSGRRRARSGDAPAARDYTGQGLAIFRGNLATAGNCRHAGGIWEHGEGRAGFFRGAFAVPREPENFPGMEHKRGIPACWSVSRVRRQLNTIPSSSAAGWSRGGAAAKYWRSAYACGKAKFEGQSEMHTARDKRDVEYRAWLERLELPVERAIEEALLREAAFPPLRALGEGNSRLSTFL